MQSEADIQKEILDFLEAKGFIVVKINQGAHKIKGGFIRSRKSTVGMSDIIGITPGGAGGSVARFISIEVKKPGGVVSDQQRAFKCEIEKRGGIALIVDSLGSLIQQLTLEV